MALSSDEIAEVKRRLGYGALTALARPYFDIALVFEEVVQRSLSSEGETYLRGTVLPALRAIDAQLAPAAMTPFLVASKTAASTVNPKALENVQSLQGYWLDVLSATVQVARVPMHRTAAAVEIE